MVHFLKSFEYHVGGQPVRVIVDGVPAAQGGTQAQKAEWFQRHADHFRRALMHEPRGHRDMTAVLLTEPSLPGSHAGLLFVDHDGYPRLLVHAVVAAATAALERGLIFASDVAAPGGRLIFDTPAGAVRAQAVDRDVVVSMVPAFVHTPGCAIQLSSRPILADLVFAGEFFAVVDSESAGLPLDGRRVDDLRRVGREVVAAVNRAAMVAHPLDDSLKGVARVVFTGPPRLQEAHLRSLVVSAGGAVDHSPSGGGTAAVMAVLDAMGLLLEGQTFVHEGLNGRVVQGRVASRSTAGELPALAIDITDRAWLTGEQSWSLDHEDPFQYGFSLADCS